MTLISHLAKVRIVYIQEHLVRSSSKVVIQFTLRLLHTLETAEAKKMRLSDICYEAEIRKCYIHQFLDVTRMTCAHFDHSNLSLRIDLQQSQRDSDAVIEITLSGSHLIFNRKNFSDQLLCCGLSVGSCQSYNSQGFSIHEGHRSVPTGKILKCLEGVIHRKQTFLSLSQGCHCRILIDNSICRTCLKGLECILITIKVFTLKGEE